MLRSREAVDNASEAEGQQQNQDQGRDRHVAPLHVVVARQGSRKSAPQRGADEIRIGRYKNGTAAPIEPAYRLSSFCSRTCRQSCRPAESGNAADQYRRTRFASSHPAAICRPSLWSSPALHARTFLRRQLGHLSVMNDKETNMIDGLRHSRQSKLQVGHLNQ